MVRAPRWLRARMGVRAASALSAAVVVAVAMVIAGAALVFLVGESLRGSLVRTAESEASQLADRVEGNYQHYANKNSFEAVDSLMRSNDLAQILVDYTQDGGAPDITVEGGTDAVGRDEPISDLRPGADQQIVVPDAKITRTDGSVVDAVLVARGGTTVGLPVYVLVAEPLRTVTYATDTLLFYLLFGVPLLILVAGAATYVFAGRALRPVEAIRAKVAGLTDRDLGTRVPVPAAHDEVGRLAVTMNAMLSRLEDSQGVQRRFVADASHELRSPLATIATGLELMQGSTVADPETVTTLRGEAERLNRLVDGLLLLARADERGLQPRREEVDLDEVAQAEQGRPSDVGGVQPQVRVEPVRVIGDRGQLVRVVRNLVDNARRHARSRVLLTVRRDGADAVIEVSDDGPGVPEAERARVFERFVRLDEARARADGGAGLGLAIVAEVVAAHGGTVGVEQAPGGGAMFRVRLPAAPYEVELTADDAPRSADRSAQPARHRAGGQRPDAQQPDPQRPDPRRPDPRGPGPSGPPAARPGPVPQPVPAPRPSPAPRSQAGPAQRSGSIIR